MQAVLTLHIRSCTVLIAARLPFAIIQVLPKPSCTASVSTAALSIGVADVMAQVYLDVNIGDATAAASADEAFSALNAHFQTQKAQLGLDAVDDLRALDEEARELITESFRRSGSDQVHRAYNQSTVQDCDDSTLNQIL